MGVVSGVTVGDSLNVGEISGVGSGVGVDVGVSSGLSVGELLDGETSGGGVGVGNEGAGNGEHPLCKLLVWFG